MGATPTQVQAVMDLGLLSIDGTDTAETAAFNASYGEFYQGEVNDPYQVAAAVAKLVEPVSMTLAATDAALDIGAGSKLVDQLVVTGVDFSGASLTFANLTLVSSDTGVVTVDMAGLVTAVADGSANIIGTTVNGISSSVDYTVETTV